MLFQCYVILVEIPSLILILLFLRERYRAIERGIISPFFQNIFFYFPYIIYLTFGSLVFTKFDNVCSPGIHFWYDNRLGHVFKGNLVSKNIFLTSCQLFGKNKNVLCMVVVDISFRTCWELLLFKEISQKYYVVNCMLFSLRLKLVLAFSIRKLFVTCHISHLECCCNIF